MKAKEEWEGDKRTQKSKIMESGKRQVNQEDKKRGYNNSGSEGSKGSLGHAGQSIGMVKAVA